MGNFYYGDYYDQMVNRPAQNVKLSAHRSVLSINPLIDAMCGKWRRLVETKCRRDHELQFQASNSRLSGRDGFERYVLTGFIFEGIWNDDFTGSPVNLCIHIH